MFVTKNYTPSFFSTVLQVREGEELDANDPVAVAVAKAKADAEAAFQARLDNEVKGLKAKNAELLGKMKAFDGLDATKLKEMQDRLDQDEDVKLLAEGKKAVVIEKYTERMRAQHITDLAARDALIKAEAQRADAYKDSVLDNQIRSVTNGLHKGAVEDALLAARQIFSLDAKGKAVQLDAEGRPVLGKDGTNPFSPSEWIETMKELKPHWFPMDTSGSGSGGARDSSGTGKTIKRADFERLSAADQSAKARSGIKIVD